MKHNIHLYSLIVLLMPCFFVSSFSQAAKPRIMVFPASVWMAEQRFISILDIQGSKIEVMDYQKALNNSKELYSVINKIGALMTERGFPTEDLLSKLNDINDKNALNILDQNRTEGKIEISPRDKLLMLAKPDIILEVNWYVNTIGPKRSVTFDLKGIDSGTNKQIASAGGTGELSFSTELPILLEEAVLTHLDNFNSQLMAHFQDMFDNGREISLDIKVWETSPIKLNDEINERGDQLKDDLKKWVKDNTVKGRYTLTSSSSNWMFFTQVRIPMYDKDGSAFDADGFATLLRKYLYETYNKIPSESGAIGLGKAEVVIGGKRK